MIDIFFLILIFLKTKECCGTQPCFNTWWYCKAYLERLAGTCGTPRPSLPRRLKCVWCLQFPGAHCALPDVSDLCVVSSGVLSRQCSALGFPFFRWGSPPSFCAEKGPWLHVLPSVDLWIRWKEIGLGVTLCGGYMTCYVCRNTSLPFQKQDSFY